MARKRIFAFTVILTLGFLTACTDTREQYDPLKDSGKNKKKAERIEQELPNEKPTQKKSQKEIDDEVEARSRLPILYGVGMAGIDFDLSLDDLGDKISESEFGISSDGVTLHDESVIIFWTETEPRRPNAMLADTGYLGPLQLPEPYGNVFMKDNLKRFFPESDPKGEKFIADLYNHFEGKDNSYNCLASENQTCQIVELDEYIQFNMPGMLILISKDARRALFRVLIKPSISAGAFQNPFDIVTGKTHIKSDEGLVESEIYLGQSWGRVKEIAHPNENGKIEALTRDFYQSYDGVNAWISRNNFSREYTMPNDTEIFTGLSLFSNYTSPILINGRAVLVEITESGASEVRLVELNQANALSKNQTLLGTQMTLLAKRPQVQKEIVRKVVNLVQLEMRNVYGGENSGYVVFSDLDGMHDKKPERNFAGTVTAVEKATGQGLQSYLRISENDGSAAFVTWMLTNSFDSLVTAMALQDFSADGRSLGGFKIGDTVEITNVDLGRGEADLSYTSADRGKTYKERVGFDPYSSIKIAQNEGGKLQEVRKSVAAVSGLSGVSLGVEPIEGSTDKYKIKAISMIGAPLGLLKDICGIPGLSFRMSDADYEVKAKLLKAIKEADAVKSLVKAKLERQGEKELNGKPPSAEDLLTDEEALYREYEGCNYITPRDPNDAGLMRSLAFPDQGVTLAFDQRELSAITIYPTDWESSEGGQQ